MSNPADVARIWLSEFRETVAEGGHVTYMAHRDALSR